MNSPKLYRRRIIPEECVPLKDDRILIWDDESGRIITSWKAIKPRPDLSHGYSVYFIPEGYKVSLFYNHKGKLIYTYCDIIEASYEDSGDKYIVTDLLADVVVYPDGKVRVVDIDELVTAMDAGRLSQLQLRKALLSLSSLLEIIYSGRLSELTGLIKPYVVDK